MRDESFFFNDTATTEIYTLSLHDALPIYLHARGLQRVAEQHRDRHRPDAAGDRRDRARDLADLRERDIAEEPVVAPVHPDRSEEHTSELQSRQYLVCRLLLEKKNT